MLSAFIRGFYLAMLRTQQHVGGPSIADEVYYMIWDVRSERERAVLCQQPLQAAARLAYVARMEGRPVDLILQEIRGAGTAIGVIIDPNTHRCYAAA